MFENIYQFVKNDFKWNLLSLILVMCRLFWKETWGNGPEYVWKYMFLPLLKSKETHFFCHNLVIQYPNIHFRWICKNALIKAQCLFNGLYLSTQFLTCKEKHPGEKSWKTWETFIYFRKGTLLVIFLLFIMFCCQFHSA